MFFAGGIAKFYLKNGVFDIQLTCRIYSNTEGPKFYPHSRAGAKIIVEATDKIIMRVSNQVEIHDDF